MSRLELAAVDMPMGGVQLKGKIVPSMAMVIRRRFYLLEQKRLSVKKHIKSINI